MGINERNNNDSVKFRVIKNNKPAEKKNNTQTTSKTQKKESK